MLHEKIFRLAYNRPYRVVGVVDAYWNLTPSGRYRTLQVKACELGASAAIDAREERVGATERHVVTDRLQETMSGPVVSHTETTLPTAPGRPVGIGTAVVLE